MTVKSYASSFLYWTIWERRSELITRPTDNRRWLQTKRSRTCSYLENDTACCLYTVSCMVVPACDSSISHYGYTGLPRSLHYSMTCNHTVLTEKRQNRAIKHRAAYCQFASFEDASIWQAQFQNGAVFSSARAWFPINNLNIILTFYPNKMTDGTAMISRQWLGLSNVSEWHQLIDERTTLSLQKWA